MTDVLWAREPMRAVAARLVLSLPKQCCGSIRPAEIRQVGLAMPKRSAAN
ncbi:MAG: hypothetical protein ACK2U5_16555 [Candidatus Promineifilaceae bacterium]